MSDMNVALGKALMTRAEFFPWAQGQAGRFEFDGFQPVAMTGGTIGHSRISRNIQSALVVRLKGTGCEALGPDAGIATLGDAVRYPDALVTCTQAPADAYLVPAPVVVMEVLSRTSGYTDRIVKLQEYWAVPTIRCYVIVERMSVGLTVHQRQGQDDPWTTTTLKAGEVLTLPGLGIDLPVDVIYEDAGIAGGESELPDLA